MAFRNHLPVDIRFGVGVVSELPALIEQLESRRPFVIADSFVLELPAIHAVLSDIEAKVASLGVFPVAAGEPTVQSVNEIGGKLADHQPDALIAIGGGSAMDSAKGARVILSNGGPIERFIWPGDPEPIGKPTVPLITVPTTAGTGSEVTGGAVMNDPARNMKVAAPSPLNRAQFCLVDPELTLSLPEGPTLWGGLDALGQAIGSVVCKANTPVGDALGLDAIALAVDALPLLRSKPDDIDARSKMACSALLAGLAMNVSEAGTEHCLAHPLGGIHHLPHGLTVGLMLVESMEHDRSYVPARFERIADAMGVPADNTSDGSRAVSAVRRLLAEPVDSITPRR